MAFGIDIHPVYQKSINWSRLDPKVEFVWLKVSDGGSAYKKMVDGILYTPDSHAAGIKSAGRLGGGYHYAEFSPTPETQAAVLAREVKRLGLTDLCPALDIEAPFTPGAVANDFAKRFINALMGQGFNKVAIYGYTAMLQNMRPDLWNVPGLIIWAARPAPVGELGMYKGRTDVHQYTSAGSVTGVLGSVDCNETLNSNLLGSTERIDDMDWLDPLQAPFDAASNYPAKDWITYANKYSGEAAAGVARLEEAVSNLQVGAVDYDLLADKVTERLLSQLNLKQSSS